MRHDVARHFAAPRPARRGPGFLCYLVVVTGASPAASLSTSAVNLRRLVVLRSIAISAQVLTVLVSVYGLAMPLPLAPLGTVIAALACLNFLTVWRLRSARAVSERELLGQLLLDVAALTAILYFSGGSTNPFVLLYLMPITLAAAALPGIYTWIMAGVTVVCYSVLMGAYVPLPHVHSTHGTAFDLHVFGMWLGFVLSAGLIAYFVVRMGDTLRERDRALAALRESALRNERILALGTLAAGAAHELGTPLSTMAVVVKELEHEFTARDQAAEPLRILGAQIVRCKEILGTLSASAGQARAESGRSLALDTYLEEIVARWGVTRPGVQARVRWEGPQPVPRIVAEQTLSQAITSLLNNAADASPDAIEVEGRWNEHELRLDVRDRGAGLTPTVRERAGKTVFTTKAEGQGLGLGLFLVHATIRRFGGAVELYDREGGGACTRLTLPLANLTLTN